MDDRLVNVHYVDKKAFMINNTDILINNEKVLVFEINPTYEVLVGRERRAKLGGSQ